MKDRTVRIWPARPFFLLAVLAVLCGFMLTLPGCGGCIQKPTTTAKKKKEDEEAAKKKKKKKDLEKPKPNFDPVQIRTLPSNDRTQTNQNPAMHIKPGHWVALAATTKANNFDYIGDLSTFIEDRGTTIPKPMEIAHTNSRLSVWRPASLPKGQAKNFETLAYIARRPQDAGLSYPLRAELRGSRGGSLQEQANIIPRALKDHQFVIVVLASNPASYTTLDKLNSVKMAQIEGDPGDPLEYYHIVRPNAEKRVPLPSHSLAWTITSHVIWDDINPAVLTEEQQQAMLDWLHWGGQIVISGPSSLDKIKGSFLGPYLPAESAETIKLDEAAFAELNTIWSLPDQKKRPRTIKLIPERPMVGVRFRRHTDSRDVPGTGGLVVERRVGGGRIVVTAFPLTDVRIKQWKNFDGFFNCVLLRRPPREFGTTKDGLDNLTLAWNDARIRHMWMDPRFGSTLRYFSRDVGFLQGDPQAPPPVAVRVPDVMPGGVGAAMATSAAMVQYGYDPQQQRIDTSGTHPPIDDWHLGGYQATPQMGVAAWNDEGAASNAARQALTDAAGIKIPKADFVFRVLIVYLAILVPLNWFVFWMLGRVEWAWIAAPIISVIGAGAVIRLAQLDIGFARSRTEIAVLEVQGNYDRAHLTRYTALYTSLSSSYGLSFKDSSALALPFASPGEAPQQSTYTISEVEFRIDKNKSLSGVKVQSNSTGMVHSEQMFPLGGKLTLVGDDKKGWTVKNTSSVTLKDVGLWRKSADGASQTAYLAELAPGTSSPISFTVVRMTPETVDERRNRIPPREIFWLAEWDKSPVLSKMPAGDDEKEGVRLNSLAHLAVEQLRLVPGDVRLVAWTDEPLDGMEIAPHAPQNTTHTLVLAHLVRGDMPTIRPDATVADDYYEPPIDNEPGTEPTEPDTTDPAATTSGAE
ncbi:MAG: hypothetical protein L0211_04915 [Planctomycetaceae bacterium]|nr:hypothetical protein [Planctomycetaceae bacterium]